MRILCNVFSYFGVIYKSVPQSSEHIRLTIERLNTPVKRVPIRYELHICRDTRFNLGQLVNTHFPENLSSKYFLNNLMLENLLADFTRIRFELRIVRIV